MLGPVALNQRAWMFKLHPASVHVCSTFSRPAAQASMPQGQQMYLPLHLFDYVALDQHKCLKPSNMSVTASRGLQACCSAQVLNVALN